MTNRTDPHVEWHHNKAQETPFDLTRTRWAWLFGKKRNGFLKVIPCTLFFHHHGGMDHVDGMSIRWRPSGRKRAMFTADRFGTSPGHWSLYDRRLFKPMRPPVKDFPPELVTLITLAGGELPAQYGRISDPF